MNKPEETIKPEIVYEDLNSSNRNEKEKLELKISNIETRIKLSKSKKWSAILFFPITMIVISFLIALLRNNLPSTLSSNTYILNLLDIAPMITVSYAIISIPMLYIMVEGRISRQQIELDDLKARLKIFYRFKEGSKQQVPKPNVENTNQEDSYFDTLVRINVDNLSDYYVLVKVHTDNSFKVTLALGIIGFFLIVLGLIFGFSEKENIKITSYVAAGSGIVIEFISSVFFYLYNRTIKQLKSYHDSLLSVQNILLSFKLVGDMSNQDKKAEMMTQMIDSLIAKKGGIINEIAKSNN